MGESLAAGRGESMAAGRRSMIILEGLNKARSGNAAQWLRPSLQKSGADPTLDNVLLIRQFARHNLRLARRSLVWLLKP